MIITLMAEALLMLAALLCNVLAEWSIVLSLCAFDLMKIPASLSFDAISICGLTSHNYGTRKVKKKQVGAK